MGQLTIGWIGGGPKVQSNP
ncbi:uncharacterized protein G2W53_025395 [Senna tora]|uniref:Uncharacterized protein n=1 Tax=Senna tora TaxID=362788 RepID=A0A834TFH7_9FABA|nr:uncharacterized protein G2W53_025395 [Senna tora]